MTRPDATARPGDPRIRRQLAALAVVLLVLWSYTAYLTARDATELLRVRALAEAFGQPTDRLILDLQYERRLTAEAIAGADRARVGLAGARANTDRWVDVLRAATDGPDLRLLTAGPVPDRVDELVRQLGGLAGLRAEADVGRAGSISGYHRLIDAAFAVYGPEWGARESGLAAETRAVIALARARELLAREDTLLSAALTNGWLTTDDRLRLTELVTTHRYARTEAAAGLPAADRDDHRDLVEGPGFGALLALEDRLVRTGDDGPVPTTEQWRAAVDPALAGLHALVKSAARDSVERATPGAALVVLRTGVVLGLGLVVVLALLFSWLGTVRRLAGPAAGFGLTGRDRGAPSPVGHPADRDPVASSPAGDPDRSDGIRTGPESAGGPFAVRSGPVGSGASAGPFADRRGPVGFGPPAGPASAEPHLSAVAGRRGGTAVADITGPGRDPGAGEPALHELFLRLTQRNQALLRDQFTLLDALERRERSAAEAAELFRLDHLVTRVRRNVETVVTLAGATPARRWRRPVPLLDAARGAVAEVADYQRVLVTAHWPWTLAGPAVTDVVHLLAELIENALVCSPENTTVRVAAEATARGCSIVVTDDGPGLDAAVLAELNGLLGDPPPGGPPQGRAGLYAAARLAARHGIRVSLRPGPRGGTAAVVWLPAGLVAASGADGAPDGALGESAGTGDPDRPPARPGPGSRVDSGGLPVRDRRPGSVRPGPGTVGSDTVEMPVPRGPRGR
ncbi:nitrate- and nitrite sensing domain-containing protein [Micromonospora sp. LZ34]